MAMEIVKARVGDKEIIIETGRMAKQADGAVMVRCGDSMVLVTAVSTNPREGIDFFPLTVDYQERLFATGRIPGSFFRREGRLTERETLTSRYIDRSLRPLFPEGFIDEVQIIATVISMDLENDTDVLALTGASAALTLSDVPFQGPIAGVRVGRVDGKLVANPTLKEREQSDLDIIMAASKDAIVMVEGGAREIPEPEMIEALVFGHEAARAALAAQEELKSRVGRAKKAYKPLASDAELKARVRETAYEGVKAAYAIGEKLPRYEKLGEVKKAMLEALKAQYEGREKELKAAFEDLKYDFVRKLVTDGGRIAGRPHDGVREISIDVGLLPRTHGSALFTRGETQALCVTTLGTSEDEQRVEMLTGDVFKKFMLHYNFPPFSVGEVKMLRGANRREIGHGALAERALKQILPDESQFPYTLRIVSDILESNGSSSMATVCGGTLSLMDAGVPIKAPVAGIAMGLIKEGEKIAILSDILGDEDHLGDMDFKVCGTSKGITSIQMDIKITGVDRSILERALDQARRGRIHILEKMKAAIAAPRADISQYAPRITTIKIRPERIKDVIGPGGKVIKEIVAKTGCSVNVEDDGSISIASSNNEKVQEAIRMIRNLTQEAEIGKIYMGTVRKVVEFGAFVEIFPGTDGLIHISDLSDKRVAKVTDVLHEGDEVLVKVTNIDRQGKIRLSRKEALAAKAAPEAEAARS